MTDEQFSKLVMSVVKEVLIPHMKKEIRDAVEARLEDQTRYVEHLLEKQKTEVWEAYARSRHNEVVDQLSKAIAALSTAP